MRRADRYCPADLEHPALVVRRTAGFRIEAGDHVVLDEGFAVDEVNAVGLALEHPQIAVAARMHEALEVAAVAFDVDQQWRRYLIPIPIVVPVILVAALDR